MQDSCLHLKVRKTAEESATLVMPFDEQLLRPGKIVTGQALMALADTAMVMAL
jgi:acyl-coenzyme A thioesterase PaaI-like protein